MAQQIQFIQLTQSEYDTVSKEVGKLYFTSDTHRIYKGSVLYAAASYDQMTFNVIEASAITVNGSSVSLEGHTHSASDIDGLGAFVSAATQNFSQNGHKHTIADVTNLSGIVSGITNTTVSKSSGSFNALTVGGSNVSVEGHKHSISDVTGLSSALEQIVPIEFITSSAFDALTVKDSNKIYFVDDNSIYKGDELYGATSFDQLEFSDIEARSITVNGSAVAIDGHTHAFNDITGLSDVLSGISATGIQKTTVSAQTGTFANSLTVGGSNVALSGHTHTMSEVTGLSASLSSLNQSIQSLQSQIVPVQCITLSQYEALQTVDASTIYFISDGNRIYMGSVLYAATRFDELTFSSIEASDITVNGSAVALEGHTHSFADVDGLSTALNGFASSGHTHGQLTGITQTSISKATANFTTVSANTVDATGTMTLNGKSVATQEYVLAQISSAIGQALASSY